MSLQPLITLEGTITFTFSTEGMNIITVQVSAGNTILQDTKMIAVYGEPCFRSLFVDLFLRFPWPFPLCWIFGLEKKEEQEYTRQLYDNQINQEL